MRLKNTIKNMKYNFIFLFVTTLLSFISRSFFVKFLGIDLLGINNIIMSLLGFLNIAELGVGMAITYSLYKPLTDNNEKKIAEIMYLFKYYYKKVSIIILFMGIGISIFLPYFIKGQASIGQVYIFYYIYLLSTVISYWFSYKQTLIIADQKQYVITLNTNLIRAVKVIIQIFLICIFKSYILWIIAEVTFNILNVTLISKKCDKLFDIDFARKYDIEKIKFENKNIIDNIKNVFVHKIASFIVYQTDGLLISLFLTLRETGIYANYMLIINSFLGIFNTLMSSFTASIGNLVSENNDGKSYSIFKKLYLLENCFALIISFTLFHTINSFMTLWVGEEFIFNKAIMFILMINIYIQISRGSTDRFKESYGIFWDKYAPMVEGIINLVISLLLVQKIGVIGLFIGTFCSNVVIILIWKPYVLYKYGFKINSKNHIIVFLKCMIIAVSSITISNFIRKSLISIMNINIFNIGGFILHSFMTLLIISIVCICMYSTQKEFKSLFEYVLKIKFKKKLNSVLGK